MVTPHLAEGTDGVTRRFYRPELDALRFFAFLAVLVHHGPKPASSLELVRAVGDYGLPMFFLLSAYLITELLLREREQSGTVAWSFFFTRRALRIWPLYYAALASGFVAGDSRAGLAWASLFVANWAPFLRSIGMIRHPGGLLDTALGPLWSISIEEQFYLIWPPIMKFGRKLALAVSVFLFVFAGAWLRIFSRHGWVLWFDTPVQFMYFGAGAIIAIATHGNRAHVIGGAARGALLVVGLFSFVIAAWLGGVADSTTSLSIARIYVRYSGGLLGCLAIFAGVLGISNVPSAVAYLGKISYGLYVFHVGMLELAQWLTIPLKLAHSPTLNMFVSDSVALLLCIPAAHFSYQYFERPFLRLKERFEVVKSRPV